MKHVLKALRKRPYSERMLHPKMLGAFGRIWQACEQTQRFFERKIGDRKEHGKNWDLNFQHLYVEVCTTNYSYNSSDDRLAKYKEFKDHLRHQREHIWGYVG